jgi:hypothetical protein
LPLSSSSTGCCHEDLTGAEVTVVELEPRRLPATISPLIGKKTGDPIGNGTPSVSIVIGGSLRCTSILYGTPLAVADGPEDDAVAGGPVDADVDVDVDDVEDSEGVEDKVGVLGVTGVVMSGFAISRSSN